MVTNVEKRVNVKERSGATGSADGEASAERALRASDTTVFLDLDTVLLDSHPGKYGRELAVQADIPGALARLSEVADKVVIVANPRPAEGGHELDTENRLDVLSKGLDGAADSVLIVTCSHGENGDCNCSKPGNGLIVSTLTEHGYSAASGWHIGGDQEGVVAGRTSGLKTIRIGPHGADHLSEVHKPDYEARDLMDAANRILMETLAAD